MIAFLGQRSWFKPSKEKADETLPMQILCNFDGVFKREIHTAHSNVAVKLITYLTKLRISPIFASLCLFLALCKLQLQTFFLAKREAELVCHRFQLDSTTNPQVSTSFVYTVCFR